jgi:hypothetical protein
MTVPPNDRATTQSLAALTAVVATLVCVAATWAFVGGVGGQVAKPAATAAVDVETANVDDGVARNDAVALVHEGGDSIEQGTLRVTVDDRLVYVRDFDGNESHGLVTDVNDDQWADLNRPGTGPPGDPDGNASNVVDGWAGAVSSGDRLVIQERNDARSVDVIDPGDTVRVTCVTAEGREVVIAEETI